MVTTIQTSFNTQLKDRVLWYDGDSSLSPERLISALLKGVSVEGLYTTDMNKDIEQFNKLADTPIGIKEEIRSLDFGWTINTIYSHLNVEDLVFDALEHEIDGFTKQEQLKRINRTTQELDLYRKFGLIPVLKAMIYIIDTFEQQNIVWGVGRGSSVSSYILYLIGVHDIDSVEYDLPIGDFFHINNTK